MLGRELGQAAQRSSSPSCATLAGSGEVTDDHRGRSARTTTRGSPRCSTSASRPGGKRSGLHVQSSGVASGPKRVRRMVPKVGEHAERHPPDDARLRTTSTRPTKLIVQSYAAPVAGGRSTQSRLQNLSGCPLRTADLEVGASRRPYPELSNGLRAAPGSKGQRPVSSTCPARARGREACTGGSETPTTSGSRGSPLDLGRPEETRGVPRTRCRSRSTPTPAATADRELPERVPRGRQAGRRVRATAERHARAHHRNAFRGEAERAVEPRRTRSPVCRRRGTVRQFGDLRVAAGVGVERLLQRVRGTFVVLQAVPVQRQPGEPLLVDVRPARARLVALARAGQVEETGVDLVAAVRRPFESSGTASSTTHSRSAVRSGQPERFCGELGIFGATGAAYDWTISWYGSRGSSSRASSGGRRAACSRPWDHPPHALGPLRRHRRRAVTALPQASKHLLSTSANLGSSFAPTATTIALTFADPAIVRSWAAARCAASRSSRRSTPG